MSTITRRRLLGGSVALAAGLRFRVALAGPRPPDLVDVRGTDPGATVLEALKALGGIGAFVKRGQRVVVKPNFSFACPVAWGASTHPDTLVAVVRACLDAGADVTIVEFPLTSLGKALGRTGTKEALARVPEARLKILGDADDFRSVRIPDGRVLGSVEVARVVLDADVYINLPQPKSHGSALVSFGLKNAMGVVRDRGEFHAKGLHEAIADVARVVRPQLTILDGTRVLASGGPAGPGETVKPGRVIAGRDVVAVDARGLTLARWNGRTLTVADVAHIRLAAQG